MRVGSVRPIDFVVDLGYFIVLGDSSSVSSNTLDFSFGFSCELSSEWFESLLDASD